MTRLGSRLLAVLAVLAVVSLSILAWGGTAGAHALRQSSFPDAGATLAKAPGEARVSFGEVPDPRLSSLHVLDTSGRDHTAGPTTVVPGQSLTLRVALGSLPDGVYTVAWRTVSKVDGHLAAGTFAFGVGVSPSSAAGSGATVSRAPGPSIANLAARWIFYVGLMLLVGGAAVALTCFQPARRLLNVVGFGTVAAAIGA